MNEAFDVQGIFNEAELKHKNLIALVVDNLKMKSALLRILPLALESGNAEIVRLCKEVLIVKR